jgi:GNAT superfamily N-acetyltransferase
VTLLTDTDLYVRGAETLIASWEAIARGSRGAAVLRTSGVAAAVFPADPERRIYNNALLERDLPPAERCDAVVAMEAAYASAEVDPLRRLGPRERRGPCAPSSRRAATRSTPPRGRWAWRSATSARCRTTWTSPRPAWSEYLRYLEAFDLPPDLLAGVDPTAFHVPVARLDGEIVATGLALDLGDDCGIYNDSTVERARRRGIGTALTARLVHDAAERGCGTATLQSTEMGEGVYASVGFRDVGRFLEYAGVGRAPV